jgi:hypothetical protein
MKVTCHMKLFHIAFALLVAMATDSLSQVTEEGDKEMFERLEQLEIAARTHKYTGLLTEEPSFKTGLLQSDLETGTSLEIRMASDIRNELNHLREKFFAVSKSLRASFDKRSYLKDVVTADDQEFERLNGNIQYRIYAPEHLNHQFVRVLVRAHLQKLHGGVIVERNYKGVRSIQSLNSKNSSVTIVTEQEDKGTTSGLPSIEFYVENETKRERGRAFATGAIGIIANPLVECDAVLALDAGKLLRSGTTWSQFGAKGPVRWISVKGDSIYRHIPSLGSVNFGGAEAVSNYDELERCVYQTEGAFAFVPLSVCATTDNRVFRIRQSSSSSDYGKRPTVLSVTNGYPWTFNIMVDETRASSGTTAIMEFLLSKEARAIVADCGYAPKK